MLYSVTSILPYITFLFFQGRFDTLICPPKHPDGTASVWVRAAAHSHESSVILSLSSFLTCIAFLQVDGAEAIEQIRDALFLIPSAQKSGHNTDAEPDDDVPGGDDGRDDDGSGGHSDTVTRGHLVAISQWNGLFTDDVSWRFC